MKDGLATPDNGWKDPEQVRRVQVPANRRRILKIMSMSAITAAADMMIPHTWYKPQFSFSALPAHAQTSGVVEDEVSDVASCGITVALAVFRVDNGQELPSDPATPLIFPLEVRYQATVTPATPDGTQVLFYFADGTSSPSPTSGGVTNLFRQVDIGADTSSLPAMQRVYARYDCGRSNTWVRPIINGG